MICPKCGSSVPDGSSFCENCGASLAQPSVASVSAAAATMAAAAAAADQTAAAADAAPATDYAQYAKGAPSTHYSSQQAYNQGKEPGYTAQQPSGQQQQSQQPKPAAQKIYAATTGTTRAAAMATYWGLLPLIFVWAVGDKDADPFIRHHLNQALVCLIGMLCSVIPFIGWIVSIVALVLAVMGTIQAYHGEITPLPLIGTLKILK